MMLTKKTKYMGQYLNGMVNHNFIQAHLESILEIRRKKKEKYIYILMASMEEAEANLNDQWSKVWSQSQRLSLASEAVTELRL